MKKINITDLRKIIAGFGKNAMIIFNDQHWNEETFEELIKEKHTYVFNVDDIRVYDKSTKEYATITPSDESKTSTKTDTKSATDGQSSGPETGTKTPDATQQNQ